MDQTQSNYPWVIDHVAHAAASRGYMGNLVRSMDMAFSSLWNIPQWSQDIPLLGTTSIAPDQNQQTEIVGLYLQKPTNWKGGPLVFHRTDFRNAQDLMINPRTVLIRGIEIQHVDWTQGRNRDIAQVQNLFKLYTQSASIEHIAGSCLVFRKCQFDGASFTALGRVLAAEKIHRVSFHNCALPNQFERGVLSPQGVRGGWDAVEYLDLTGSTGHRIGLLYALTQIGQNCLKHLVLSATSVEEAGGNIGYWIQSYFPALRELEVEVLWNGLGNQLLNVPGEHDSHDREVTS